MSIEIRLSSLSASNEIFEETASYYESTSQAVDTMKS